MLDETLTPEERAVVAKAKAFAAEHVAPNAARRAKKMGYGNAMVMSAGISGWLATSLPTEVGQ